jgi:hypothetical protein
MKNSKIPAWMRSSRPDTIHKNCINVQDGIVEACDFDPAMCQACETTLCKWHPSKQAPGQHPGDEDDEDDADEPDGGTDDDDADSAPDDRDEDDRE